LEVGETKLKAGFTKTPISKIRFTSFMASITPSTQRFLWACGTPSSRATHRQTQDLALRRGPCLT
jgi:hypothetical protein